MLIRCHFIILIAGMCAGMAFVPGLDAATRYVSLAGGHDEAGGFAYWSGAATTIQAAVNISGDCDVILVSNGVYSVSADTTVVRITNSLNIRGYFGRDVTVIDGLGARRVVIIAQTASAGDPVYLSGFTIANGLGASSSGGGGILMNSIRDVYVADCVISNNVAHNGAGLRKMTSANQLTLSNCWISHNTATDTLGGGIYVSDAGRIELFGCRIASNSAVTYGGALHIASVSMLMEECQVVSNATGTQGGGLMLWTTPGGAVINRCAFEDNQTTSGGGGGVFIRNSALDVFISNCVIRGNSSPYSTDAVGAGVTFYGSGGMSGCLIVSNMATAGYGAGLVLGERFVRCDNLTIAHNHANNGAGGGGLYVRANVTAEVFNSIVYDNTMTGSAQDRRNINFVSSAVLTFNNCCTTPLAQLSAFAGTNNFDADPLFVGWVGDAYLYQLQRHSPCINTGTNLPWMAGALDLAGRARLDRIFRQVDLGCYEYIPRGTLYNVR